MRKHIFAGIAVAVSLGSTAVDAQSASNSGLTVDTNQSLVGAEIGDGIRPDTSIVTVTSNGTPAVGVGALSGDPRHYGSALSLSALNSARLLGVDTAAGPGGANSVSLKNPKGAPVLSSIAHR